MTANLTSAQGRPGKLTTAVVTYPQVNLLPPEVAKTRRQKSTKRLLLLSLLLVVLVAVLGYGVALYSANEAADDLADAQSETTRLQNEKAEYAEVPRVLNQIELVQNARIAGTATEVNWAQYIEALRAVTPAGVSYESITVSSVENGASMNPFVTDSIGTISFTTRSLVLPDTAAWVDAVEPLPGLSDPWFTSATRTDEDGSLYYLVQGTVNVETSALAGRFIEQEEGQ